jgi:hypothetical protein
VTKSRRPGRLLLLALALVASVLAYVVPAQAATPKATSTRVHLAENGPDLVVTAVVWSKSGVPAGTVVFTGPGSSDPLGPPVALDAAGRASITLPGTSSYPFGYSAAFTGAEGWADSTGTVNPFGEPVRMTPVGTILHIGGPGLIKILTQTFSAKVAYESDGAPAVGEEIIFTQKNKARGASGHPEMDPRYVYPVEVCRAVVDATGYATCTAEAPLASLVTLLTTPAWANHEVFPGMESTYLPIIGLG